MVTLIFLSHCVYADNDAPWKQAGNEIVSVVTVIFLSHSDHFSKSDYSNNDAPRKNAANEIVSVITVMLCPIVTMQTFIFPR